MTLVTGKGSFPIAHTLAEPAMEMEYAATLDGGRMLGDKLAMPRPLRIPAIATGDNLEEVHQFLIALGAALRTAIRLEWPLPMGTYVRTLRPGGRLTVRETVQGPIRYEVELLPDDPTWIAPNGSLVALWV